MVNRIMIRKKEINNKPGTLGKKKKKNPYLKPDGSIELIDEFPGTDYLEYSIRKGKGKRKR